MKHIISLVAAVLALAGVGFFAYVWHWEHRPHVLEIYCFALDKSGNSPGNLAVFIRTPDGHTALIDGGKTDSIASDLASVMPFYRRSIDVLISTNPDDSHVTGLADVIERYHIGKVIEADVASPATSSAYLAFENEISAEKIPENKVSAGDGIDFGDPSLSVSILFPTSPTNSDASSSFPFSKTNIPVLAFAIRYGTTEIIFGGNITKKEQAFIGQGISSSSDPASSSIFLILPHGENSGVADESFFTNLHPQNIVVLKNPAGPAKSPKAQKNPDTKQKKPAKAPFAISSVTGLSITNLAEEGDTEFISNGHDFSKNQLK
jgi:hypothetical protein